MVQNGAFVFHQTTLTFQEPPQDFTRPYLGCAILSVACQKALGWRRLASKAMSPANSPTGLLSSAIFFNHYTTVFLISAISAWFFIPFQAESGNAEPGSWRPEARSLHISATSGKHNPRRAFWIILVCSYIVCCTTLWCLYLWLPNLAASCLYQLLASRWCLDSWCVFGWQVASQCDSDQQMLREFCQTAVIHWKPLRRSPKE